LFLFVFADDGATVPVTRDQQKSLLRARYADAKWEGPRILDEVERTSEFYFDSVSQIRMRRWSEGRVALVGDAAFCVSLLAGQGSALAMISAYVLAGELARSPDCHADAFARYQDRLDAFINRKQLAAARFGAAFAPKTRRGLAFRNLVVRAMGIPGVSKLVFGGDITDSLTLPDYPWRG
jgi:2-polyprenyl-6-methoxyphenol hydroxylase-like FAD-dependent oxidoreductase